MVLLLDVLQVDALNDHGWVFGLQIGIDTKCTNLSDFFIFLSQVSGDRPKPGFHDTAHIMKITDAQIHAWYPNTPQRPWVEGASPPHGPERMLWGSDVTRLDWGYADNLRLFTKALEFLSANDREWILCRAAAKHCDWPL